MLNRYYVLVHNTRRPSRELKATSAFRAMLESFPAYFLITYEKIEIAGMPIGSGQHAARSEFQGNVLAVRMPLACAGRTDDLPGDRVR